MGAPDIRLEAEAPLDRRAEGVRRGNDRLRVHRDLSRRWTLLAGASLAALIAVACAQAEAALLLQTLPREAGGEEFDMVQVVDEAFLSGHPVDDVLAALGKTRRDATAVFVDASGGAGGVGALRVDGISGEQLFETVLRLWNAASVMSRAERTIGTRRVWRLENRNGHSTLIYQRGVIVYLASSFDAALAESFVREMP